MPIVTLAPGCRELLADYARKQARAKLSKEALAYCAKHGITAEQFLERASKMTVRSGRR